MNLCKKAFLCLLAVATTLFCIFALPQTVHAADVLGDANGDSKVNLRDAIMVLQAANGKDVTINRSAADVTGDGKVNLQDAIRILKRANGNKDPFPAEPSVKVMTYAEFVAAELDTPVVVESYIQATQSWWNNSIAAYTQNEEGAYFVYKFTCTEEEAAKLVPGTKVRITGYKGMFMGEIEILDATFEILEGNWIATALDVTDLLGTDELITHQNKLVAFKGMTIEPIRDIEGNEHAFLYGWEGSGEAGSDLYFNASINGATYNFRVESCLTDADTEVYKTVEALKVGDVVDLEGFLYWYDWYDSDMDPHITSVTPAN